MNIEQERIWNLLEAAQKDAVRAQAEVIRAHSEEARALANVGRYLKMSKESMTSVITVAKANLNAELFLGVTDVYFDEETERIK